MAIKEVRTGILNQLKANASLVTFINSNANNIKVGLEEEINLTDNNVQVVRIKQISEDESFAELSGQKKNVEYRFHVVGVLYEPNPETAEDTSADFCKHIKNALCDDLTLSGTVHSMKIDRTFYFPHPEKNLHYVIVPVTGFAQVIGTNR